MELIATELEFNTWCIILFTPVLILTIVSNIFGLIADLFSFISKSAGLTRDAIERWVTRRHEKGLKAIQGRLSPRTVDSNTEDGGQS